MINIMEFTPTQKMAKNGKMTYVLYDENDNDVIVASDSLQKVKDFFIEYSVKSYIRDVPDFALGFDPLQPKTDDDWEKLMEYFEYSIREARTLD